VSLLIYGAMPVLYFLSITVLRSGRQRNQEYADFTRPTLALQRLKAEPTTTVRAG
jgi:hypothetical protein